MKANKELREQRDRMLIKERVEISERSKLIALRMLKEGFPMERISEVTSISVGQIRSFKSEVS